MTLWPFKPKPLRVQIVQREPNKLRLEEFRADTRLVGGAQSVAGNEYYRLMLQVLENETPAGLMFPMDSTLEARALHQARIEGYNLALNNLRSMTVPVNAPEPLLATFEEPEKE